MAFVTTFLQDTSKPGVGTVTATQDGINYSRRVDTNDAKDVAAFVAEAKAKCAAVVSEKASVASVADKITTLLNKVV